MLYDYTDQLEASAKTVEFWIEKGEPLFAEAERRFNSWLHTHRQGKTTPYEEEEKSLAFLEEVEIENTKNN